MLGMRVGFNLYHTGIGDLNPTIMGLLDGL
jgi:hypothetical protein